jgi:hypothetical protein
MIRTILHYQKIYIYRENRLATLNRRSLSGGPTDLTDCKGALVSPTNHVLVRNNLPSLEKARHPVELAVIIRICSAEFTVCIPQLVHHSLQGPVTNTTCHTLGPNLSTKPSICYSPVLDRNG